MFILLFVFLILGFLVVFVLEGWLYVVGGLYNGFVFKSVECYDLIKNEWI